MSVWIAPCLGLDFCRVLDSFFDRDHDPCLDLGLYSLDRGLGPGRGLNKIVF